MTNEPYELDEPWELNELASRGKRFWGPSSTL